MEFLYPAEMEGELLLIGIIAILGAFIYHKLDKMMQLQNKTNKLLEKLAGEEKKEETKKEQK